MKSEPQNVEPQNIEPQKLEPRRGGMAEGWNGGRGGMAEGGMQKVE